MLQRFSAMSVQLVSGMLLAGCTRWPCPPLPPPPGRKCSASFWPLALLQTLRAATHYAGHATDRHRRLSHTSGHLVAQHGMHGVRSENHVGWRFTALVLGTFGSTALCLTVAGPAHSAPTHASMHPTVGHCQLPTCISVCLHGLIQVLYRRVTAPSPARLVVCTGPGRGT